LSRSRSSVVRPGLRPWSRWRGASQDTCGLSPSTMPGSEARPRGGDR
jgi:hypothetical protein